MSLPNKICADCQKQIVAFYIFKQRTKRTEESLLSIFTSDATATDDIVQESVISNDENVIVEHAQNMMVDVYEVENCPRENIEATDGQPNFEIFDFNASNHVGNNIGSEMVVNYVDIDTPANGNSNNKHDKIIDDIHHVENDVLPLRSKEEPKKVVQPKRTVHHRTVSAELKYPSKEKHTRRSKIITNPKKAPETEVSDDCDKLDRGSLDLNRNTMDLIIKYLHFYPCHNCCLLFGSEKKLNEHNLNSHPIGSDQIDDSYIDYQFLIENKQFQFRTGEMYSCGECYDSYQSIDELKSHVTSHFDTFECPIKECGCQYNHLARLSQHVFHKHINTRHLLCLHCDQAFPTFDDLQMHLKNACTEKRYECYECGRFHLNLIDIP